MSKQTDFLEKFIPIAVQVGNDFSLNPAVILAQAALEGNFGLSYGAKTRKNHFGITAFGSTNKYWDGSKSQSNASGLWFRIYKTDYNGFADFARLITSKYPTCAKLSFDIPAYAKCIAQSPYISESNGDNRSSYENSVKKYAQTFEPMILEYKRGLLLKKRILYITIAVSLSIIVAYGIYFKLKYSKK